MLNQGSTAFAQRQDAIEHRSTLSHRLISRRSPSATLLLVAWPALCLALVVARLAGTLTLPWALVLAPIWLPMLAMALVLLAAMWMDQLSTRARE
jgi:hypothetical protein